MKPFTMHAVLKYRGQLEDSARQRLYQALEQEARLHEALMAAEAELDELYIGLARDQEQGITVDRLVLYEQRIELVKAEAAERHSALARQQSVVAKCRQQLIKASKEKKIIEKIREHQDAAYARHLEKKEAAMLDEVAVLRHERKPR